MADRNIDAGFFQFAPVFGDVEGNVRTVVHGLRDRAFDLMVLPELFNTGYQFVSPAEVSRLAEPVPDGPTASAIAALAREKGSYIAYGIAEEHKGAFFNSAVLTGPEGFIGVYRKTHLFLDEKRWFSPGDTGFRTWKTAIGTIGIMVCFDWFFPESMRVLSLQGADVIAHPSNLVLPYCPRSMPVRCLENCVFAITANRTGSEARTREQALRFIGMSQITGTDGTILHRASETGQEITTFPLDPAKARNKNLNHMNHLFHDRRPEWYGLLASHPPESSGGG